MNLLKTNKPKQTVTPHNFRTIVYPNQNSRIPKTTASNWRWKQHSWAAYQLSDGMKVMSARRVAQLAGQPITDVINFVQSNDLETLNVIIPSRVVINAITLPSIAIYLQRLLEEDKLQHRLYSIPCDILISPFFIHLSPSN